MINPKMEGFGIIVKPDPIDYQTMRLRSPTGRIRLRNYENLSICDVFSRISEYLSRFPVQVLHV